MQRQQRLAQAQVAQQAAADACVLAGHPAAFSAACFDVVATDGGAVEWLPGAFDAG